MQLGLVHLGYNMVDLQTSGRLLPPIANVCAKKYKTKYRTQDKKQKTFCLFTPASEWFTSAMNRPVESFKKPPKYGYKTTF